MKSKVFSILLIAAAFIAPLLRVDIVHSAPAVTFSESSYTLPGGLVQESSPVLADLTGDGLPEILVGTTARDGNTGQRDRPTILVAMRGQENPTPWFQVDVGAPIKSSPAVGDIDGDGEPEVVVSVGGEPTPGEWDGGIRAYNRFGSQLLWFFNPQDYPADDGYADGVYSSPLLCDVDADGDMEIAFGAWDQRIYLLDHNGNSLWEDPYRGGPGYFNADTIWSSATCADLNNDGYKEIIIGADSHAGGILPDGTIPEDGGWLYIFDKDGNVLVRRDTNEAIYSSPAVGDLDGDGDWEIVVGTSYTYWLEDGRQPYVYAFDTSEVFSSRHYSDPDKLPDLPGWPRAIAYPGFSSPALADLDGDEDLEIVIGSGKPNGASKYCSDSASDPDCYGAIYAWHHTSTVVSGFPMWPKDYMGKNSFVRSSPTVGDIDNDGQLEILFTMLWDVVIVGPTGSQEYNLHTNYSLFASPAIGDTDDDDKIDIWIGGSEYWDRSNGYLWRFESDTADIGETPWPMFHRDARHTGRYPSPPRLNAAPQSLYVMHQYGSSSSEDADFTIASEGEGVIEWQVTSSPARVSATPSSGEANEAGQIVDIEISTSGLTTGTHDLGSITLVGTVDGEQVENSPIEIPVSLYVGNIHTVYTPFVLSGN